MMSVREVSAAHYRSLHRIRFPVDRLTLFVGANGVGKTNLYRVLQLLQAAAAGSLARELAAEGGMDSALWAGERKAGEPARIKLCVGLGTDDQDQAYSYEVETGLVPQYEASPGLRIATGAGFLLEPQIKSECLTQSLGRRSLKLLERQGASGFVLDANGKKQRLGQDLLNTETALGALRDAANLSDLHAVRSSMLEWRFYHDFRTDAASALRQPCLAVTTPSLSSDGSDLAAVFATLAHIKEDTLDLDRTIDEAFPGARLVIPPPDRSARFGLVFPDYPKRVFEPAELSDGTLRYLALAGALLAYRLPPFIALNEPETSLHPDLLEPLARLIVKASKRTQIWLVTHSEKLADAIARESGTKARRVIKKNGETWIEALRQTGTFGDED